MIANSILAFLALVALGCVFWGPWQDVCTDWARQVIFEKRDALFDLARGGRVRFDSSEYRAIRFALEQYIRFAHDLTISRIVYALIMERPQRKYSSMANNAIDAIHDKVLAGEIKELYLSATKALLWMMVAKSMLCVLLLVPLLIASILLVCFTALKTRVYKGLEWLRHIVQIEAEIGSQINPLRARSHAWRF